MKLVLSILISIIAILIGVYPQEPLLEYMRGTLRTSTINNISKTLKLNGSNSFSTNMTANGGWVGLPTIPQEDPSLNAANPKPRGIQKVFEAIEQAEGAGAIVRRSIGTPRLRNFTPFLMLDHFRIAPGAGFPDHPHRGQETITYLLEGELLKIYRGCSAY